MKWFGPSLPASCDISSFIDEKSTKKRENELNCLRIFASAALTRAGLIEDDRGDLKGSKNGRRLQTIFASQSEGAVNGGPTAST
jgi:hypothetical protein